MVFLFLLQLTFCKCKIFSLLSFWNINHFQNIFLSKSQSVIFSFSFKYLNIYWIYNFIIINIFLAVQSVIQSFICSYKNKCILNIFLKFNLLSLIRFGVFPPIYICFGGHKLFSYNILLVFVVYATWNISVVCNWKVRECYRRKWTRWFCSCKNPLRFNIVDFGLHFTFSRCYDMHLNSIAFFFIRVSH